MRFLTFIISSIIFIQVNAQQANFTSGFMHCAYICSDGKVYSWGNNAYNQLGRTNYLIVDSVIQLDSVVQISAGKGFHTLAVSEDKSVWAWGANFSSQLGINNNCLDAGNIDCDYTYLPHRVHGGQTGNTFLRNAKKVSAGESHSLALLESGEVVAWGDNTFGQLGNNQAGIIAREPSYVLTSNNNRLTGIVQIAAGANHSYALTNTGIVYAWGNNSKKQLSDGTTFSRYVAIPMRISGTEILKNITAIDAGGEFGLFLHSSGVVYASGAYKGLESDGNTIYYYTEEYVKKVGGGETNKTYLENVKSISAGYFHSLAIVSINGIDYAVSWGDNKFYSIIDPLYGGQLGSGLAQMLKSSTPVFVKKSSTERLSNISAIAAGAGNSLFQVIDNILKKPILYGCGANNESQLGDLTMEDSYYAKKINLGLCEPLCPVASLGNDLNLCSPINYELQAGSESADYTYSWYKDGIKLTSSTGQLLTVTEAGNYKVSISDKITICPASTDEVVISEKNKEFTIITRSFCLGSIPFEVYGAGYYEWYNASENGELVGVGSRVDIPVEYAEVVITDSIYRLWIEEPGVCQRLPVYSKKYCGECGLSVNVPDTSFCRSPYYTISIAGSGTVYWFDSADKNKVIGIGSPLQISNLQIGENWFYYTVFEDVCETDVDSFAVILNQCNPVYTLKGKVIFPDQVQPGSINVFYNDFPQNIYSTVEIDENGEFMMELEEGFLTLCFIPVLKNTFDTIWFGNTTIRKEALTINMQASIIDLKLDYTKAVEIDEITKSSYRCIKSGTRYHFFTDEIIKSYFVYSINGSFLFAGSPEKNEFDIDMMKSDSSVLVKIITETKVYYECIY